MIAEQQRREERRKEERKRGRIALDNDADIPRQNCSCLISNELSSIIAAETKYLLNIYRVTA